MHTPGEKAIQDAIATVEGLGWADPLLTDAVLLLEQAKGKVADFMDRKLGDEFKK
jgi:hypothetical protein